MAATVPPVPPWGRAATPDQNAQQAKRMKHTPGKLELANVPDGKSDVAFLVRTAHNNPLYLGRVYGEGVLMSGETATTRERAANAQRLVTCWNCHDELVAALQNAVWKLQDLSEWSRAYCHPQQASSVTATADECRAILAKAKGEA